MIDKINLYISSKDILCDDIFVYPQSGVIQKETGEYNQAYNEYIKWKAGNEAPENVRHYYLKKVAVTEISRHVSMWIRLEMSSHIKEDTSNAKFAVYPQYQCSSLFATMMIEALSGLNNVSRYRVCRKCKNIFDIGNGRSDRKYCSEECKELARYRREQEKREREREARRSQN